MTTTRLGVLLSALSLSAMACAAPKPSPATASDQTAVLPPAAVDAANAPSAQRGSLRERPELGRAFAAERVAGTIALFDSADPVLTCSDVVRCAKAVLPASTFKIANSMIGLETGVLEDAETKLAWDGKQYSVPDWNQDHTLRTAMRVSCVPCFQQVARSIGQERMSEWLGKLGYGNRDTSGGVDSFWLSGGLRISPVQQIEFLRRFDANELPLSQRTTDIVREILTLDVGQTHVFYGKTGLAKPPEAPELTAWFVGWVELGARRVFFATLIDEAPAGLDVLPVRRRVTERVLADLGYLPVDRTREAPGKERP